MVKDVYADDVAGGVGEKLDATTGCGLKCVWAASLEVLLEGRESSGGCLGQRRQFGVWKSIYTQSSGEVVMNLGEHRLRASLYVSPTPQF